MPIYHTRLINSDFDTQDDGAFHENADAASKAAILAAAEIATELLAKGEQLPHIEVIISEDEVVVARHVVTLSVAHLD